MLRNDQAAWMEAETSNSRGGDILRDARQALGHVESHVRHVVLRELQGRSITIRLPYSFSTVSLCTTVLTSLMMGMMSLTTCSFDSASLRVAAQKRHVILHKSIYRIASYRNLQSIKTSEMDYGTCGGSWCPWRGWTPWGSDSWPPIHRQTWWSDPWGCPSRPRESRKLNKWGSGYSSGEAKINKSHLLHVAYMLQSLKNIWTN